MTHNFLSHLDLNLTAGDSVGHHLENVVVLFLLLVEQNRVLFLQLLEGHSNVVHLVRNRLLRHFQGLALCRQSVDFLLVVLADSVGLFLNNANLVLESHLLFSNQQLQLLFTSSLSSSPTSFLSVAAPLAASAAACNSATCSRNFSTSSDCQSALRSSRDESGLANSSEFSSTRIAFSSFFFSSCSSA
ncbi:hypothetical protein WR25_02789 [Diploscapter pachys]|uniref:Uncharacterized protein n=1 Tax=Diploscapter pachys TaxID=2018661 RepID=A0A2A2LAD6_9BILA|nr:hypothetical protein WR25_02789 [Diploscapter pachys]